MTRIELRDYRLDQMLTRLSVGDVVEGSEIAALLGVDRRTVYRYAATLRSRGVPILSSGGVGYMLRAAPQPVAWQFELAKARYADTGEYTEWGAPQLSFTKPHVPTGAIRNLRPLTYMDKI